MDIQKLKKQVIKNPVMTGLISIFAISCLFSLPKMMQEQGLRSKLTDKKDTAKHRAIELKLDQKIAETEAEIAKQRFKSGCKIALDKADPTKYLDLVEGEVIALPEETPVCSRSGHIGKIKNGKLTDIVYDGQPQHLNGNHLRVFNGSIHLQRLKQ